MASSSPVVSQQYYTPKASYQYTDYLNYCESRRPGAGTASSCLSVIAEALEDNVQSRLSPHSAFERFAWMDTEDFKSLLANGAVDLSASGSIYMSAREGREGEASVPPALHSPTRLVPLGDDDKALRDGPSDSTPRHEGGSDLEASVRPQKAQIQLWGGLPSMRGTSGTEEVGSDDEGQQEEGLSTGEGHPGDSRSISSQLEGGGVSASPTSDRPTTLRRRYKEAGKASLKPVTEVEAESSQKLGEERGGSSCCKRTAQVALVVLSAGAFAAGGFATGVFPPLESLIDWEKWVTFSRRL